jgi:hypothetical protein
MGKTVSDANGTTYFFSVNGGEALAFKPKGLTEAQAVLVYYHGHNSTSDLESYMASTPRRAICGRCSPQSRCCSWSRGAATSPTSRNS